MTRRVELTLCALVIACFATVTVAVRWWDGVWKRVSL